MFHDLFYAESLNVSIGMDFLQLVSRLTSVGNVVVVWVECILSLDVLISNKCFCRFHNFQSLLCLSIRFRNRVSVMVRVRVRV